jgi:subtilisin family serine protease
MNFNKIDSSMSYSLVKYNEEKKAGLNNLKHFLSIESEVDVPKPARIIVFIACDENANLVDLEKYNIIINQQKGKIRTGLVPLDNIHYLQEDTRIKRITSSKSLQLKMDSAVAKVHLNEFIQSTALTGNGVLIGIVDSGIDPKHPAFHGRILRIWDQTLSGDGVQEGRYGLELKDNLITSSRDQIGHGTHVAGISAGSNNNEFDGIASKSNLIIVKTDLEDAHIADGVRYIFRLSKEMDKPCVCNLSLGGHIDPHDGSDDLCKIIDEESGPGRIVCCAAGNEGDDAIHSRKYISNNKTTMIDFRIPISGQFFAIINCWYSGNDEYEVSIRSPSGFITPYQGVSSNSEPRIYNLPEGSVSVSTPPANDRNNDHNILIIFDNTSSLNRIKEGLWSIHITGKKVTTNGIFDAWINDSSGSIMFFKDSIDDSVKIGSPASALRAITVGSFTTKIKWINNLGQQQYREMIENDVTTFSNEGPLRNNLKKPDILAPGAMICSTLSRDSRTRPESIVNNEYCIKAGTSMAAPFVAGIIALLLEKNPSLTPEKVKELLVESSQIPQREKGLYDIKWGYGLIDTLQLLSLIR